MKIASTSSKKRGVKANVVNDSVLLMMARSARVDKGSVMALKWASGILRNAGSRLDSLALRMENGLPSEEPSIYAATLLLLFVTSAALFLRRRFKKQRQARQLQENGGQQDEQDEQDEQDPGFDWQPLSHSILNNNGTQGMDVYESTLNPDTWKNYGPELYKEAFGEEAFQHFSMTEIPPHPQYVCPCPSSIWDAFKLKWTIFKIRSLMGLGAHITKARPTHTSGPGARGDCQFLNNPNIPPNPFFSRQNICQIRVRHSDALGIHKHNAGYEPRGMSIKFDDAEETAPLDLLLNTGETMGFFNLPSFWEFTRNVTIGGTDEAQQEFAKKYPLAVSAGIGGFRRAPDSYTDLHYYSQIVYEYKCTKDDGIKRYCKFRTVPLIDDDDMDSPIFNEQSGLPDLADQRASVTLNTKTFGKPRSQDLVGNKISPTYLMDEFHNRLEGNGQIKYRLQIQVYEFDEDIDDHEVFNPNKSWCREKCPFHDIAILTLDEPLEQQQTDDMLFNVGRLPCRALSLIPAISEKDYNSIAHTRAKIYRSSQRNRIKGRDQSVVNESPRETKFVQMSPPVITYVVTTRTGTDLFASTRDNIKISFIGKQGQSSYVLLRNNLFRTCFLAGNCSSFQVVAQNVGELLAVKVERQPRNGAQGQGWQIESLTVQPENHDVPIKFLAAHWVGVQNPCFLRLDIHTVEHFYCEDNPLKDRCMRLLKAQWPWSRDDNDDFPLHADYENPQDLPPDYRFRHKVRVSLGITVALGTFGSSFSLWLAEIWQRFFFVDKDLVRCCKTSVAKSEEHYSIDWYRHIFSNSFSPFRLPERADRWRMDAEFADRFISGANPLFIRGVDEIPEKMNITEEMAEPTLSKIGETLSSMLEEKKIFYIDFSQMLEEIKTFDETDKERIMSTAYEQGSNIDGRKRYVACAQALFYEHPNEGGKPRLMPLAIQLYPEKDAVVFLPSDNELVWLAAKLHFMCADSQVHQFVGHLFFTHLMVEPIVVAMNRCLPPVHPIARLLYHHTQGVCAINTLGRKILVGDGGIADEVLSIGGGGHIQIMSKVYKHGIDGDELEFMKHFNHQEWTKMRNMDRLGHYPYRDDGNMLWDAIHAYVTEFICNTYTEELVARDTCILEWLQEIKAALRSMIFPDKFESRQQLIDFVTVLIFRLSCGHASVNFSQYDHYAHVPSAPVSLMSPPPTTKDPITANHILDMMPPKSMMKAILINLNNLSSFTLDEKFLGQFYCDIFTAEEEEIVTKFQGKLKEIGVVITDRNNNVKLSNALHTSGDTYHYLHPLRVPNGINI